MGAYFHQQQAGTFLANGRRRGEVLDLWNHLTTESTAAPFSTLRFADGIPPYSISPLINQQDTLATSLQAQYRLTAQCLLRLIDLFRINSATLLNFKHLMLPPQFPLHIDSIRADLLSQQMTSSILDPIRILEYFRQETVSTYAQAGNMREAPAMFSYATAGHHSIPTQLGVSAPRSRGPTSTTAADVRDYRRRQCWGKKKPPAERELWMHGNCAEHQSLPSVVAWCERLGLENVCVETLAVKKSGESVGMCKNCMDYVWKRVLRKHPTWKVYDAYTTNVIQIT